MPRIIPRVELVALAGSATAGLAIVGSSADRGCPACNVVMADGDDLVFDARGRYWHQQCATQTLAEHTRLDEDRPDARYRWRFDSGSNDISDADLDAFIAEATGFPVSPSPELAEAATARRRRFREALKAYAQGSR